MSRILSQHIRRRHCLRSRPLTSLLLSRHRSRKAQLIEIDLDSSASYSSSSSSSSSPSSSASDGVSDVEAVAIKKLEDMIHRIIVQKSTPDWLPFIPGSSFWVPPQRRSNTIVDLVSKLSNQLTEEESLSLTTARGWPCSSFLFRDNPMSDVENKAEEDEGESMEMKVDVKVEVIPNSENTSQLEDEEG